MKDPMKPVVPIKAEEMKVLDQLEQYMSRDEFHAYLEKRALDALFNYRNSSDLEDLEEMQFFMHRITHHIIEGVKETEEYNKRQEEIKRLNVLSSIYEGDDG